jgi:hypothetical protein
MSALFDGKGQRVATEGDVFLLTRRAFIDYQDE